MLQLKNSVAVLALLAFASALPPAALAQDQPEQDLDSLVDSLSVDDPGLAEDAVLPEVELLTDVELDELVAPVALYPDALLAQVLVASTYPLQIVKADRIIAESEELSDDALSETLSEQEFDPSVLVLLSGFPTVVQRMAEDLEWTERLGIAMLQQDDDVLAAVQRMRADARAMGYLSSNDAQVIEEEAGQIYIQPADPEVVYVPSYDPSVVYASPAPADPYYVAPAQSTSPFSAQNLITTGVIAFGSALLVNELWGDDDDDDDDDDDWDDYWRRPRPIAWQDREFYPRPYWNRDRAEQARAWSWERDRSWRRSDNRWRREELRDRREEYQRDRREALGYMRDPQRVRALREKSQWRAIEEREQRRRQAIRAREERRDDRQDIKRREERRDDRQDVKRREERREDAQAAERQQRRLEEQQRDERAERQRREERAKQQRAAERREDAQAAGRQKRRLEEQQREQRVERQRREERAEQQRAAERKRGRAEEERRDARAAERRQAEREQAARREEAVKRQQADDRASKQQRAEPARQEANRSEGARRNASENKRQGNDRGEQARQKNAGEKKRCRNNDKDCK